MRWRRVAVAVCAAAAVLGGCTSSSAPPAEAGDRVSIDGQRVVSHGQVDVGGRTSEELSAGDFFFDPTVVTGSGGQTITLTVSNPTSTLHNFTLPGQGIDQDLPQGQSVDVTVRFPPNGALAFFCKYHRSQGMVGELFAG